MDRSILDGIGNFFIDRSIKLRSKILAALLLLLILMFLNDITGFTFYYTNARKVEQVERLTEALNDDIPQDLKHQMQILRSDIMERKSTLGELFSSAKDYFLYSKESNRAINAAKQQKQYNTNDTIIALKNPYTNEYIPDDGKIANKTIETNNPNEINAMNRILFILSSSGIYFLLFILFCFIIFTGDTVSLEYDNETGEYIQFPDKKSNSFLHKLGLSALALLVAVVLALLSYMMLGILFSFPIFGRWLITYVIVFVLSLLPPCLILLPAIIDSRGLKDIEKSITHDNLN